MRSRFPARIFTILCLNAAAAFAGTISLQEIGINVNGVVTDTGAGGDPFSTAGVNASAFDQNTGLGTLTFTFNPGAAGSYYVDFFLDPELNLPFYNEYGVVNGAIPSGGSYEIGDPYASSIYGYFSAGTLSNTNQIPGQVDNYLGSCQGSNCNGDVSMALGFNFVIPTGDQAVITLNGSTTNPGGFSLEQIHPVDPNNSSEIDYYFTGNVAIEPIITGNTPEPGSLWLAGAAFAGLGLAILRKKVSRA